MYLDACPPTVPKKKNRGVWGAARPPVYEKMQIYRCSHKHNYIYNYILVFPPADRAEKKQGGLGGGTPPSRERQL